MALRLSILGGIAGVSGVRTRWTFGVNGGRIGRASDNDWVLLDEERYVSSHHAEIEHRGGEWWIRDTSTNGTFVNGSRRPLGPGERHRIEDGDRIRLGSIQLIAEITASDDEFPPDEDFDLSETALDSSFEVRSLLSTAPKAGKKTSAADVYGQPLPDGRERKTKKKTASGSPRGRSAPVETFEAAPDFRPNDPVGNAFWPGLVAFCKGAGLDPYALPPTARAAVLQAAGQALRETMVGLMELARARAEFTREMGVTGDKRLRDATSPLMQVRSVDDALNQLLTAHGHAGGGGINEVSSQFAKTRHHQQSMLVAMREALPVLLDRFHPDQVEQQFARSARAAVGAEAQTRFWAQYRDLHKSLVEPDESGLPAIFAEEFARAYSDLASVRLRLTARTDDSG
jgi:predicted component of type VI protein secretion system